MTPDASQHDPRPEYLRALITASNRTQRDVALAIGVSERLLRCYLAPVTAASRREAPYPVQYAIECLAADARGHGHHSAG
jgi:hypothetical protein